MKLFNFIRNSEGKYIKEEVINKNKIPAKIVANRKDGTTTTAFDLNVDKKIRHKDNSVSCLVKGKVLNNKDSIKSNYICFEVPEGRLDLIETIINNNTGMKLNNNSYTYIGRAFSKYDVRLQPPTHAINNQIEILNKKIQDHIDYIKVDMLKDINFIEENTIKINDNKS